MFCKKCGNQLKENALFCSNCGEKCIEEVESTQEVTQDKPKTSIGEKILRFICIVAIVFTTLIGTINLLTSNVVGGIIILLVMALLIILVFRKEQISQIKSKFKNTSIRKIVVTSIYLLLPIIMFTSIGIGASIGDSNSTGTGSANHDAIAISYAESNLKNQLKNPESLQIHSSKVYVDFEWGDYHYYTITIDYSAQNGFGGYNRNNDYDVILKINKNTNVASKVTTEEYLDAITKYNDSK